MSSFIDKRLAELNAYIPGEQPEPGRFIKLNTNEFPYPCALNVSDAVSFAVTNMNLYSDLNCSKLKYAFEKVFGFSGNNVIFTNGSDEALYLSFLAFCGENTGAAFADITYGFYSVYADICGIEKQIIPLDEDFEIVPEDYFNLGKTIFIANPNAPTGKMLSIDEIERIVVENPQNIVIIDEAYADFSGQTCSSLVTKYDNVIIIGTFSKSRGMAGARLGYIIASEPLISDIEKVKYSINPYNVNSLTQAAGTAVLESDQYYKDCVDEICQTRDLFSKNLEQIGFEVIDSNANFIFAKHKTLSGSLIAERLREKNILIRHFNAKRISDYVRITIGTPEQMNIVLNALEEITGGK